MDRGYSEEEWRLIEGSGDEKESLTEKEELTPPQDTSMGEADAEVLAGLGVTSVAEADLTKQVIKDAEELTKQTGHVEEEGPEASERELDLRRVKTKLLAVKKEIAAVQAGLEEEGGLEVHDEVKQKEEQEEELVPDENVAARDPESQISLQRALASQRLHDLKAQRRQLREELASLEEDAEGSGDLEETGNANGLDVSRGGEGGSDRAREKPSEVTGKKRVRFAEESRAGEGKKVQDASLDAGTGMLETERDRLIRTGVLTPFSSVQGYEKKVTIAEPKRRQVLVEDEDFDSVFEEPKKNRTSLSRIKSEDGSASQELQVGDENDRLQRTIARTAAQNEAIYKAKGVIKVLTGSDVPKQEPIARDFHRKNQKYIKRVNEKEEGVGGKAFRRKRPVPSAKFRVEKRNDTFSVLDNETGAESFEDGETPRKRRRKKLVKVKREEQGSDEDWRPDSSAEEESLDDEEEEAAVVPVEEKKPDVVIEGGLRVPGGIYERLFAYQQTGVRWMWELHCQKAGGIIGDEMGLGKTVQVVAFLGALHYSGLYRPSLVVCPVTLLRQWRREIQTWYPKFKVAILHESATATHSSTTDASDLSEEDDLSEEETKPVKGKAKKGKRWDALIAATVNHPDGLLLTSYEQLRIQKEKLLDIQWGYVILDEGHRIRNPDADITLVCKQLQTVHRLVMSGAPIQNKLTELWSLFDFVFPGKLGTLPVFQAQFALPIAIGGYSNATQLQASTAYKCAVVLRDLIMPYLLRRMKADVEAQLPNKTEQVLFVNLTEEQRSIYRAFLASNEVESIINGDRNALYGIDIMRKICNHPDLLERDEMAAHPDYGNPERSGKLKVVAKILPLWLTQGHRVLLFCQTQQMLDIVENFVVNSQFVYRRMDGNTPINQRMAIIDEFNNSEEVFILILTTKVGGLGTNLVGANRVIIFDPDWNPSTDMQARERAWRIGQKRDVTVYRLITSGTIEEKVYHRQIYKHFLTNKILRDPRQRRFFKAKDLTDLFTLGDGESGRGTETSEIFGGENRVVHEAKPNVRAQLLNGMRKARESGALRLTAQGNGEALEGPSRKGKEKVTDDEEGLEGLYREETTEEKPKGSEEETGLLKSLFESTGVHSTMDHDRIVGANDPENVIVDYEANRVARRAAEALKQSRVSRANADVAVPTWTGRSGAAGAPDGVRRRFGNTVNSRIAQSAGGSSSARRSSTPEERIGFSKPGGSAGALSSSALLAKMREGRAAAEGAGDARFSSGGLRLTQGSSRESSPLVRRSLSPALNGRAPKLEEASTSAEKSELEKEKKSGGVRKRKGRSVQPEVLIRQICTALQERGGSATSADLVQHFQQRISGEDMALFRQLLKQIATLTKGEDGAPSTWSLKPEYS